MDSVHPFHLDLSSRRHQGRHSKDRLVLNTLGRQVHRRRDHRGRCCGDRLVRNIAGRQGRHTGCHRGRHSKDRLVLNTRGRQVHRRRDHRNLNNTGHPGLRSPYSGRRLPH
jgi:hypothetical protein